MSLKFITRWAVRPLAGIVGIGLLVTLAEQRFRTVRKQLIRREDEFWPDAPMEPSLLAEAA